MSTPREAARLRLGLKPLTTSALGSYNPQHLGEPISAVSMASSHLPSTAQTPSSAIQPYNPQEWIASPGQQMERQQHMGDGQGKFLRPSVSRSVLKE